MEMASISIWALERWEDIKNNEMEVVEEMAEIGDGWRGGVHWDMAWDGEADGEWKGIASDEEDLDFGRAVVVSGNGSGVDSYQEEQDGGGIKGWAEAEDRESLDQVIDNENTGLLSRSQSPVDPKELSLILSHKDQFRQGSPESDITANLGPKFAVEHYCISPAAGPRKPWTDDSQWTA